MQLTRRGFVALGLTLALGGCGGSKKDEDKGEK